MKLSTLKSLSLALVAGTALSAMTSAQAQNNSTHSPASLILTFQNPGGTVGSDQTITVAINDAIFFRDAALGSFSSINVAGLGAALSNTFGSTWYEQSTLWMGVAGYRGTGGGADPHLSSSLTAGDPQATLYFSRQREIGGSVGGANSVQPNVNTGAANGTRGAIQQVKTTLEDFGTTAILVRPTSTSFVDENLPFTSPGVQSAAYADIGGGVQGNFGADSFGSFGSAGQIELGLDLYRIQFRNDLTGQSGLGEATNSGKFLGTIAINQSGDLSYLAAIPEPSTIALLVIAGVAGFFAIRRRRANS